MSLAIFFLSITLSYSHFSHCVFKLFSSAFEHILVSLTKINKTENKSIYTFPYTPYLPGTVLLFYFPHTQKSLKQCILFLSFCTCAPSTYSHLTARKGNSPRYWQPTTLLLSPVFNSPQHDISWAFPFWNIFFPLASLTPHSLDIPLSPIYYLFPVSLPDSSSSVHLLKIIISKSCYQTLCSP